MKPDWVDYDAMIVMKIVRSRCTSAGNNTLRAFSSGLEVEHEVSLIGVLRLLIDMLTLNDFNSSTFATSQWM